MTRVSANRSMDRCRSCLHSNLDLVKGRNLSPIMVVSMLCYVFAQSESVWRDLGSAIALASAAVTIVGYLALLPLLAHVGDESQSIEESEAAVRHFLPF